MKKIALFIYSDSMIFPPTINAANVLAENGYDVTLIDIKYHNIPESVRLNPLVERISIGSKNTGIRNVIFFFRVPWLLKRIIQKKKIEKIISYDGMSVLPVFLLKKLTRIFWIYHQHDYWETASGWLRLPFYSEIKLSKYADIVTFPQSDRAQKFKKIAKLKQEPLIIHNGPRKNWTLEVKPNSLIKKLKEDKKIILIYQGGWSKRFSIQEVIKSLKFLPEYVHFIILGKELEIGIKNFYHEVAKSNSLGNRVHLIGSVNYDDLPSYTYYSDFGIANFTFAKNETTNNLFLAGASNKLTEYFACSLPIIAPNTEVNLKYLQENGRGLVPLQNTPEEIGKTIKSLIENKKLYKTISENNKSEFEYELNFDSQFEKLLKIIE